MICMTFVGRTNVNTSIIFFKYYFPFYKVYVMIYSLPPLTGLNWEWHIKIFKCYENMNTMNNLLYINIKSIKYSRN